MFLTKFISDTFIRLQ